MAKNKSVVRYLLCAYCCIVSCFNSPSVNAQVRDKLKHIYDSQIGIREKTGHNDGVMVETFLRYCGLAPGNPWCASTVCYDLGLAGIKNPKSGYCPDLFKANVIYRRTSKHYLMQPQSGDVWGLYFPEKGRVAHVGFVDQWQSKYVITVEGNTNEAGSREGDGVYRKRRLVNSIYVVSNYIDKK